MDRGEPLRDRGERVADHVPPRQPARSLRGRGGLGRLRATVAGLPRAGLTTSTFPLALLQQSTPTQLPLASSRRDIMPGGRSLFRAGLLLAPVAALVAALAYFGDSPAAPQVEAAPVAADPAPLPAFKL